MSKLRDIMNNVAIDTTDSTLPQRMAVCDKAEQQIKDLIFDLIVDELNGCDGYEAEQNSSRCQWCGETKLAPNHDRSRLIQRVEAL